MHLRVNEVSNIVAPIRPLKLSKALDLRIHQVAPINVHDLLTHGAAIAPRQCYLSHSTPLFVPFAADLTSDEVTAQFDTTLFQFFYSFAPDLVLVPLADILSAVDLPVPSLAVEEAIHEVSLVNGTIRKRFLTFAPRLVLLKLSFINRSIHISQHTFAELNTLRPVPTITSPITPLASTKTCHFSVGPFPLILPPLILREQQAVPMLEASLILTLIEVAVLPLANA